MHIYDKKLNGEVHPCKVCGVVGQNIQHHIGGRRYDDRCIWVCHTCHMKIHNPISYNLVPTWAYDNGYLLRRGKYQKDRKDKKCRHARMFFSYSLGYRCQICGKLQKSSFNKYAKES